MEDFIGYESNRNIEAPMTKTEAQDRARNLHMRISAVLTLPDLDKVADAILDAWRDGNKSPRGQMGGEILDVSVGGKKAWLAT